MTGAVDVSLDDVPAKAAVDGGGTLEVVSEQAEAVPGEARVFNTVLAVA